MSFPCGATAVHPKKLVGVPEKLSDTEQLEENEQTEESF